MSVSLIDSSQVWNTRSRSTRFLNVSEFYMDTIQGEGVYTGVPSAFLRLSGCPFACKYCDTIEVWKKGTSYSFAELFSFMEKSGLIEKLKFGHHLVITGGSPLYQQKSLISFLKCFYPYYGFTPFVEIENECRFIPKSELYPLVKCWNNSPKLSNSGVPFKARYRPEAIIPLANIADSWFKFVISKESDWDEVEVGFIVPGLINKSQIILMPEGATRTELEQNREMVIDIAIENEVRYSSREQIIVWDKKFGI